MTFTSIPPSLKPVVEDVARAICMADGYATGIPEHWGPEAEAAILAFLNACVERKIGIQGVFLPGGKQWVACSLSEPNRIGFEDAFIVRFGATDDTA